MAQLAPLPQTPSSAFVPLCPGGSSSATVTTVQERTQLLEQRTGQLPGLLFTVHHSHRPDSFADFQLGSVGRVQ